MITKPHLLITLFLMSGIVSYSQSSLDSLFSKIDPQKWSKSIEKRLDKLEDKIIAKSEKTLSRLQKQEEKIYRKELGTKDSLEARAKLAEIESKYKAFEDKLKNPASVVPSNVRQYIPHLDTLKTVFKFLSQSGLTGSVKDAFSKVESLEGHLQQAEEIKKFIRERRQQLKAQLEELGLVKELKKYNKELYYYTEQIKEYKAILSDPNKIEHKAIELLSKTKLFQDFFRKNSMLASLFRMPGGNPNDPAYMASLAGLQTRVQVNNLIQQQLAVGGPNALAQFRQNIQQAQAQLQQLKNKIIKGGGTNSDDEIPDFKPNNQKAKSFLKRLEYGTNIQSQRASGFFPVTSDIGLSLGYKLNNKSIIGIGASYKLGWGQNIRNIRITQQGAGLRSFIDWKIKGSFWISGGYEMNYRTVFNSINQLRDLNAWQQSGLMGLSKVVSVKTKFFKKTKLQLLWDFLSYKQVPRTQPIIFRVGYNFK